MWGINEVDLNPRFLGATRLKYVLTALKSVFQGKVLEIGCGGGAFCRAIKKHRTDLKVIGCDINQKVLQVAKKIDGGIIYKQADVYQLPFKDNSFEVAVSFDVWEHLEFPEKAFKEVFRVLKPEGIFHFFVPLEGSRWTFFQLLPKKLYQIKKRYTGHIQSFTKNDLLRLLSDTNFKIKKINFSCFCFYQLVDLTYFLFLRIRGRNAAVSVEGYLQFSKGSFFDKLLLAFKTLLSKTIYLENEVFNFWPKNRLNIGGGIHITAIKNNE